MIRLRRWGNRKRETKFPSKNPGLDVIVQVADALAALAHALHDRTDFMRICFSESREQEIYIRSIYFVCLYVCMPYTCMRPYVYVRV